MMEELQQRAVRPDAPGYAEVAALYEEAFPPEERIDMQALDRIAEEPGVEFAAYYDGGALCGFSYSVDTGACLYLLFLAISGNRRSCGYGTRVLERLKARFAGRTIVLEVEPLDPRAANARQRERRLAFYRRNGFSPAGFESIEGDMVYTVLTTSGPFDPDAFVRDVARITRGLIPMELRPTWDNL